jgi:hypothetical protein
LLGGGVLAPMQVVVSSLANAGAKVAVAASCGGAARQVRARWQWQNERKVWRWQDDRDVPACHAVMSNALFKALQYSPITV